MSNFTKERLQRLSFRHDIKWVKASDDAIKFALDHLELSKMSPNDPFLTNITSLHFSAMRCATRYKRIAINLQRYSILFN